MYALDQACFRPWYFLYPLEALHYFVSDPASFSIVSRIAMLNRVRDSVLWN